MAEEAVLDNLTISKFFCHKCNLEISRIQSDYTCPICQSGFIEVLEQQQESNEGSGDTVEVVHVFEMLNDMLMGLSRGGPEERRRRNRRQDRRSLFSDNPGDYPLGREDLDTIIIQLLNQMDGTGPPPLTMDKIQEIPIVIITQDQVDSSLKCSVCWENFEMSEPVRKLACEHVYHELCIIPWLKLHGTCPICRKTLTDDGGSEENAQTPLFFASRSVGRNLAALFRAANESASRRPSSNDSTSTSTTNNTSYEEHNMDFEYD